MNVTRSAMATAFATAAFAGCGGDGDGNGESREPRPGSAQAAVRSVVADYVKALGKGDADVVCASLTDQGKRALAGFVPSGQEGASCNDVVAVITRRNVAVRRARVDRISVMGSRATARIRSSDPRYESGVLLTNVDGQWRIAYPPGLVEGLEGPPGVPVHDDEPGG